MEHYILSKILYIMRFVCLISVCLLLGCNRSSSSKPQVVINTTMGNILVELYPDKAPQTVAAFLKNVDTHVYDNGSFYRVLKIDGMEPAYNSGLIQGGIYQKNPGISENLPAIAHESPKTTGITHTTGTISMARTTVGSAKSEFFICIGDQQQYDSSKRTNPDGEGFAAFGKVVEGMTVVRQIQNEKNTGDQFNRPIIINSISRK